MIFTIFGATGDLTTKKLIPALYSLYTDTQLPVAYDIICIGRREYNTALFLDEVKQKMSGNFKEWDVFKKHIRYYQMDFTNPLTYKAYDAFISSLMTNANRDRIFYLATAPRFFPIIAKGLMDHGTVIRGDIRSKIVFEKPFGEDLQSAMDYNKLLLEAIDEEQIYRIDHYLGKEMLQNIIMLRLGNKIFENIWNHENVESVKIIAYETESVKDRGGYYDKSGALKDMIQNHLFQTLALVGMDPPQGLNDRLIKDEKVKVLKSIQVADPILFGQYDGYLSEKGIPNNSKTETFVALKLFINSQRWRKTPFYLVTGKKMDEKLMRVVITFKDTDHFFERGQPVKNTLTVEIFPREGIEIQFNGKAPGLQSYIMPMKLDYCHMCNVIGNTAEAYEKLIVDVIHDDASLFTRWDEIEASWKTIDGIETLKQFEPLLVYKNQEELKEAVNLLWKEEIL